MYDHSLTGPFAPLGPWAAESHHVPASELGNPGTRLGRAHRRYQTLLDYASWGTVELISFLQTDLQPGTLEPGGGE